MTAGNIIVFAVSGAVGFDPHAGIVYNNNACSSSASAPTVTGVSTSLPYDLVIGWAGRAVVTTASNTVSTINGNTATAISVASSDAWAEYYSASSQLSATSCNFGTSRTYWSMFCDALTADTAYVRNLSPTVSVTPGTKIAVVHSPSVTVTESASIQKVDVAKATATVSVTPSVKDAILHKVADTITATVSVANNILHKIADTITITPSISCTHNSLVCGATAYVYTLVDTITVTPSLLSDAVHYLADTVTITPSISCTHNSLVCGAIAYVYNVIVSVSVKPVILCVYNLSDCVGVVVPSVVVGPNIDWVLLIPLVMVILLAALAATRRRRR
jgi:hypothetical protein